MIFNTDLKTPANMAGCEQKQLCTARYLAANWRTTTPVEKPVNADPAARRSGRFEYERRCQTLRFPSKWYAILCCYARLKIQNERKKGYSKIMVTYVQSYKFFIRNKAAKHYRIKIYTLRVNFFPRKMCYSKY